MATNNVKITRGEKRSVFLEVLWMSDGLLWPCDLVMSSLFVFPFWLSLYFSKGMYPVQQLGGRQTEQRQKHCPSLSLGHRESSLRHLSLTELLTWRIKISFKCSPLKCGLLFTHPSLCQTEKSYGKQWWVEPVRVRRSGLRLCSYKKRKGCAASVEYPRVCN